jgi:hypothetical protein
MSAKIDEVLSGVPNAVSLSYGRTDGGSDEDPSVLPDCVVATFNFSESGFGFGEITFVQTPRGLFLDTEHMSVERVKRYLSALVDSAVLDTDLEPERHSLYNRAMRRRCGSDCEVCLRSGASAPTEPPEAEK